MAREICPIFEREGGEKINLIGAWMLYPQNLGIVPDAANFLELGHIGPMAAAYFRKEPWRSVPNTTTDLGHGCKFVGGAFLMGTTHAAPNEDRGRPNAAFAYVIKENNGIPICVREKLPGSSVSNRKERRWWEFWKSSLPPIQPSALIDELRAAIGGKWEKECEVRARIVAQGAPITAALAKAALEFDPDAPKDHSYWVKFEVARVTLGIIGEIRSLDEKSTQAIFHRFVRGRNGREVDKAEWLGVFDTAVDTLEKLGYRAARPS